MENGNIYQAYKISIHAPHAGSDPECCLVHSRCSDFNPRSPCGERLISTLLKINSKGFQSTLPMRGATTLCRHLKMVRRISIHAPHAGSDYRCRWSRSDSRNFNPRSPCGERRLLQPEIRDRRISIHAPHAGSDRLT